jgi:bifunctional DNA-binding transcriptional regulator/antitoxin component of YhaV-PrlF toxin-antitoxin module
MCPQEQHPSNTPETAQAGTEPGITVSRRVLAPVIPPAAARPAGQRGRARGPLPLARPPALAPVAVVYALGRVDDSGRIIDRAVTGALGWRGGDRLTLTAEGGVVLARRDPGGMVTLPDRPRVVIPASLRHRCGLRPGDPVLLAALPGQDALAAWPLAVVDQALRAHAPFPHAQGGLS